MGQDRAEWGALIVSALGGNGAASSDPASQPILDQMRQAEFATASEVVMRFVFVSAAGVALTVYSADWFGLIWAFVYLLSQTLHYLFLATCRGPERLWQVVGLTHPRYALTNVPSSVDAALVLVTGTDAAADPSRPPSVCRPRRLSALVARRPLASLPADRPCRSRDDRGVACLMALTCHMPTTSPHGSRWGFARCAEMT